MRWNEIPTWVKAGISLALIQLGLTIIFWITGLNGLSAVLNSIGYSIIPQESSLLYLILGIILSSIIYFVIGAIIGWIYYRLKK